MRNAVVSTFESTKTDLIRLLSDISIGSIQLPDFQRGWIWDDEHIRSLLASVSLSYPIGTVMLLQTGNESVRFMPRPVEGVTDAVSDPELLILDGQQRLTSLYQSLFYGRVVETRDARKKPTKRWYYIDMKRALDPNADREEIIIGLPEGRMIKNFRGEVIEDYSTPDKEYEAGLFPLAQVFDCADWRGGYNAFWEYNGEKVKLFDDFEREIVKRFERYEIPIIRMLKETPKEAVCQVFEKVNTGGVTLTVFELLTASFAADDFSLRDDWAERRKNIRTSKVLSSVQSTDFLQVIALLVTYAKRRQALETGIPVENAPGISCKRKDILRMTVDEYKQWADRVENGFIQAARFLRRQKIFTARDLPYRTQAVPLAAVMTVLGNDAEKDGVQTNLSHWYWCGVLGELYGSAVESRFARDLPEVVDWIHDGRSDPKTVEDANFVPDRLYTLRTRNSAAYKGIHTLLMRDGCLDFRTGQTIEEQMYYEDSIDIHHIFPRDWCNRYRIDTGKRDCIINKTPIAAKTNRMIGGRAPSEYLSRLERKAEIDSARMDEILRSHLVDPLHLRANDFSAFFEAREAVLLGRIEEAMGKAVIRETVAPEFHLEDDYEGAELEEELIAA